METLSLSPLPPSNEYRSESIQVGKIGEWLTVVLATADHALLWSEHMARLSEHREAVCGWIETHVSASFAAGWAGGEERWRVSYDFEKSEGDFETTGKLPAQYEGIRRAVLAEHAAAVASGEEIDVVINAPIDLVHAMTGFHFENDDLFRDFQEFSWALAPGRDLKERRRANVKAWVRQREIERHLDLRSIPWYRRWF